MSLPAVSDAEGMHVQGPPLGGMCESAFAFQPSAGVQTQDVATRQEVSPVKGFRPN